MKSFIIHFLFNQAEKLSLVQNQFSGTRESVVESHVIVTFFPENHKNVDKGENKKIFR
jgi:hypothetical protein